jgi:hypothetical protein
MTILLTGVPLRCFSHEFSMFFLAETYHGASPRGDTSDLVYCQGSYYFPKSNLRAQERGRVLIMHRISSRNR